MAHPNHQLNRNRTVNEVTTEAVATVRPMRIVTANGTIHEIPGELRYPGESAKSHRTWIAYAIAYEGRYGAWPIWNATVGGRITKFIERVGAERAPRVAVHFVRRVNEEFVVKLMHPVKLLLSDAEKWATQAQTGATMTGARAKQIDQTQSNFDTAGEAMAMLRARRAAQPGAGA